MERCFISLTLPNEIIEECKRIQNILEEKNLFKGKLTPPDQIHLTLKFLGEIEEETIEKVKERLSRISFTPINVQLSELGAFSPKHIRIIWLKLENTDQIQKQVDNALEDLFPKENRFMSHITIARVKNVIDKENLIKEIKNLNPQPIQSKANSFALVKSTLTKEGPIYETIERYK